MTNDPQTGRPFGDHGSASDAIDFALERAFAPGDGEDFLRAWREGSLEEWPEFYVWLRDRESDK